MIWGENTTSQQAIEILPVIPDMVSAENCGPFIGGAILITGNVTAAETWTSLAIISTSMRGFSDKRKRPSNAR
jgi:hypothetical protein